MNNAYWGGDENDIIVNKVFKKYSSHGSMSSVQFSNVISNLSLHLKEFSGIKRDNSDAVYYFFISGNFIMDIDCFKSWWSHPDKFLFFGKKSESLMKAYKLYKKYSSISKKGETVVDIRKMDIKEFTILLEDLGLTEKDDEMQEEEFDLVDTDGDGILSFREFCTWLNWF